jgi:hypothetical protein
MESFLVNLTYEVELKPGEAFSLPKEAAKHISPGKWWISIRPAPNNNNGKQSRGHSAFLTSYANEDEGLYDDYPTR